MEELNSYSCSLDGRNVVSAGAGTGKTYNIQILALREILRGISIQDILVVTFTNLATEELQDRLRRILQTAMAVCEALERSQGQLDSTVTGIKGYDQVLPCFMSIQGKENDEAALPLDVKKKRLKQALQDFDSAPISTIHGFCSRMLKEHAFESNMRYGMEIRKSSNALVKSLLCEFYRDFCKDQPADSSRLILLKTIGLTPDELQKILKPAFSNPDVPIHWGDHIPADSQARRSLIQRLEQSASWNRLYHALMGLTDDERANFNRFIKMFKAALQHFWVTDSVDFFLSQKNYALINLPGFLEDYQKACKAELKSCPAVPLGEFSFAKHCTDAEIEKQVHTNAALRAFIEVFDVLPPESHRDDDLPQGDIGRDKSLRVMLDWYKRLVACEALNAVRTQLAEAKIREGFLTYDDLLLELKNRLLDPVNGPALRDIIRNTYKCIMVDEFQDTDSTQAAIFSALFKDMDTDVSHTLFMIGDEKQAIYKFRGGDVQTFQTEQKTASRAYTLAKNFRSTGDFIAAMNNFWNEDMRKVFFLPNEDIQMPAIEAGPNGNLHLIKKIDCTNEKDIQIIQGADLLTLNVNDSIYNAAEKIINDYVQNYQFCRIEEQDGRKVAKISDIHYSDIAILLRSSTNIEEHRKVLREAGIATVYIQGQSAFKAEESAWLLTLMDAVLNPGDQAKAMSLLSSRLFGLSPMLLDVIRNECLPEFQMTLKKMNELWQNNSFFAMVTEFFGMKLTVMIPKLKKLPNALLSSLTSVYSAELVQNLNDELMQLIEPEDTCLMSRVMTVADDGERSLSLLQQIIEKLMNVATEQHLGQMGLFTFLSDKLQKAQKQYGHNEENQHVDEDDDDDEVYPSHLTTQADAVKILTIHKSKGLQFPIVLVPEFTAAKANTQRETVFHEQNQRVVNLDESDKAKQQACDNEAAAEKRRLMYVAITRAIYACQFIQKKTEKDAAKLNKPEWFFDNPKYVIGEKKAEEANLDYSYKEKYGCEPLVLSDLCLEPDTTAKTTQDSAPQLSPFSLKSKELKAGWVTTSFTDISRTGKAAAIPQISADAAPSAEAQPVEAEMETEDSFDDDDSQEDTLLDTGMQQPVNLVPFAERTPIFQFPGGKRTGVCWHEVFENLDFTLWHENANVDDKTAALADVRQRLEHYGQLGRALTERQKDEQDRRFEAFTTMLQQVLTCPVTMASGTTLRLCDIPMASTLRELKFTYRPQADLSGDELRRLLEENGITPPEAWSHSMSRFQNLTGAIDLLFKNPADGKFYIVDWKTNILNGSAESFTNEGVKAEIDRRFYLLQCVLYTLVFIQYYRQTMYGNELAALSGDELVAKREAYGRKAYESFGGCMDIFVRGVDGTSNHGIHTLMPSYELIKALDETIGVLC